MAVHRRTDIYTTAGLRRSRALHITDVMRVRDFFLFLVRKPDQALTD